MMTSCPACGARFRLNQEKFSGQRLSLKCVRCQKVFIVNVPTPTATAVSGHIEVLVAHSDAALCAMIGELLEKHRIVGRICHDGENAFQLMQKYPPQVALIDVALPGLYAFEVVEKIRALPGLEEVKIILLSSVYNKTAYKRTPSSLYGADDYIEKHHIPIDLITRINDLVNDAGPFTSASTAAAELTVPAQTFSPAEEQAEQLYADDLNDRIQAAETAETMPVMTGEMLEKAHRLARNIVSDIALYNQDKVETGIRNDSFYTVLEKEITEGRRLYGERYSVANCGGRDILQEEFDAFIARRRAD